MLDREERDRRGCVSGVEGGDWFDSPMARLQSATILSHNRCVARSNLLIAPRS